MQQGESYQEALAKIEDKEGKRTMKQAMTKQIDRQYSQPPITVHVVGLEFLNIQHLRELLRQPE